ncbi:MAG: RNA polymerase sigma factor region1.1 domain-containing protein [Myxococcales bacterium]|nr:RNA polymerase sigma factor region1.1 domain-containing protein [Myxococcales bacterium]
MSDQSQNQNQTSAFQEARKELFKKGRQQGYLTFQEISDALGEALMTPADRWLLFYSLRAMGIQLLDMDIDLAEARLSRKQRMDVDGDGWEESTHDECDECEEGEICEDLGDQHPPI